MKKTFLLLLIAILAILIGWLYIGKSPLEAISGTPVSQEPVTGEKVIVKTAEVDNFAYRKPETVASEDAAPKAPKVFQENTPETKAIFSHLQAYRDGDETVYDAPCAKCVVWGIMPERSLPVYRKLLQPLKVINNLYLEPVQQKAGYFICSKEYKNRANAQNRLQKWEEKGVEGINLREINPGVYALVLGKFDNIGAAQRGLNVLIRQYNLTGLSIRKNALHTNPMYRMVFTNLTDEQYARLMVVARRHGGTIRGCLQTVKASSFEKLTLEQK